MVSEHDDRKAYEFLAVSHLFGAKIQPGIIKLKPLGTSRHGENSGTNETASQCEIRPFSSHFKIRISNENS